MNDCINYPCHCENTSNDGANMYDELEDVLFGLIELYCDGRELIVKHENWLWGAIIRHIILGELVNMVTRTWSVSEVGGDCYQIEVGLKIFDIITIVFLYINLNTIKRVHNALVWKTSLNDLEMFVFTKGYMIDFIRKVKMITLHLKTHQNIIIGMRWNMEISRNSIDFNVTL
jgi:hypothetical protein